VLHLSIDFVLFFLKVEKNPTIASQQTASSIDFLVYLFCRNESNYSSAPEANTASFREKGQKESIHINQVLFAFCK
jgi:hypothetical protein